MPASASESELERAMDGGGGDWWARVLGGKATERVLGFWLKCQITDCSLLKQRSTGHTLHHRSGIASSFTCSLGDRKQEID